MTHAAHGWHRQTGRFCSVSTTGHFGRTPTEQARRFSRRPLLKKQRNSGDSAPTSPNRRRPVVARQDYRRVRAAGFPSALRLLASSGGRLAGCEERRRSLGRRRSKSVSSWSIPFIPWRAIAPASTQEIVNERKKTTEVTAKGAGSAARRRGAEGWSRPIDRCALG
jgi:hypothetical protein